MYIGLAKVISKDFINKLITYMQIYKFGQAHLCTIACASELYYNCYNLLGRLYNWINCYIILQGKLIFIFMI